MSKEVEVEMILKGVVRLPDDYDASIDDGWKAYQTLTHKYLNSRQDILQTGMVCDVIESEE